MPLPSRREDSQTRLATGGSVTSVDASTTNIHQRISISPLLRRLARHEHVDGSEIDAARALLPKNAVSENQAALLIILLRLGGQELQHSEQARLDAIITVSDPSLESHKTYIPDILKSLLHQHTVSADAVAEAVALIFDDRLVPIQCTALLGCLAYRGLDREPLVLAKTAEKMRSVASQIDRQALRKSVKSRDRSYGAYNGGLCDIVGTGGDGHSTFNVSTTASIVASSILVLSKHGSRASSSTSGSADLLQAIKPMGPDIEAITAEKLPSIYHTSNYAFLFAPVFHPGMRYVATIRRDIGIRTIFNVLGPLANPVEGNIEARIVGVAEQIMGPVFAEALRLSGAKKAMIVCGLEDLDEISCAGKTNCWRLFEGASKTVQVEHFQVGPEDFGLQTHPLHVVAGGKRPDENAEILVNLLEDNCSFDDPILAFVLMNTAALLAVAGVCEDSTSSSHPNFGPPGPKIEERGPGQQRWKEGVRIARWAIASGAASNSLQAYISASKSHAS